MCSLGVLGVLGENSLGILSGEIISQMARVLVFGKNSSKLFYFLTWRQLSE